MKSKIKNTIILVSIALAASVMVSCNNIFHGLHQQFPIHLPLIPQIEYTFPNAYSGPLKRNMSIILSFNKNMDFSTLSGDSFVLYREGDPDPVTTYFATSSDRIIILSLNDFDGPQDEEFDFDSWYRIAISHDIADEDGLVFPAGFELRFMTAGENDRDVTNPQVVRVWPEEGSLCSETKPAITAVFSEDLNPAKMRESNFIVERDSTPAPVSVDGEVTYRIVKKPYTENEYEYIATFVPAGSLEKNARYDVRIAAAADLAGNFLQPDPTRWMFRTGSVMTDVENACNISNGSGSFGDVDGEGPLAIGYALRTNDGRLIYDMFRPGDSLQGIFDPGVSGPLAPGRYIRIVERGRNVMTGLGLKPVMRLLAGNMVSPPGDQCYIDPLYSLFVLPRPAYWSKMENMNNALSSANIRETDPSSTDAAVESVESFDDGKFGDCFYKVWHAQGVGAGDTNTGGRYIYPFGEQNLRDIRSGTISFWGNLSTSYDENWAPNDGTASSEWRLISDILQVRIYNHRDQETDNNLLAEIIVNDQLVAGPVYAGTSGDWHHVYVEWDSGSSIGGKSLVIYIDNAEILSTVVELPSLLKFTKPYVNVYGDTYANGLWTICSIGAGPFPCPTTANSLAYNYLDNLKWFNHVVRLEGQPAGPSWEYNNGDGRENALHAIYGTDPVPEYDYRPRLVGPDGGVGYYYLP